MLGQLPADKKLERSDKFMQNLHLAMQSTHDTLDEAYDRLLDVGSSTKTELITFKTEMEAHLKGLVSGSIDGMPPHQCPPVKSDETTHILVLLLVCQNSGTMRRCFSFYCICISLVPDEHSSKP